MIVLLVSLLIFRIVSSEPLHPNQIWDVSPPINNTDELYAGWDQIPVEKEVKVYDGVAENRTYAHHPELFYLHGTVYLSFSSAPIDEDSMGQEVWIATSKDSGHTWTPNQSLLPAALLPNQNGLRDYSYWCDRQIPQYLGTLAGTGDRYLISNPRSDEDRERQPFTIAMSRGKDPRYKSIGVLRTHASISTVPGEHKNHGFSYPTAVQVGNKLLAAYSENKENIWVSVVDMHTLP